MDGNCQYQTKCYIDVGHSVNAGVEAAMGVQQDAHWSTEEELKLKWWARLLLLSMIRTREKLQNSQLENIFGWN